MSISESAATQLLLTISVSTGAMGADESTRHLWNRFHWWFQSLQWLSFHLLFLSQQGLRALMNPRVTRGRGLVDDFWVGSRSVFVDYFWVNRGGCANEYSRHLWKRFRWWFLSLQGLRALTNPCVTFGINFVDDFRFGSGSVFNECF